MASVILTGSGLDPASHSQTGQIGNTVTASVAVSNTGSAVTYVRLAMRGGAVQQNGYTHRVDPGTSNKFISTTALLYASAGGKSWKITATLYETNANGDAIRTVDTHANYKLTIEKPYVPPQYGQWGDPSDDATGWDDTVNGTGNGNGNGEDYQWESSGGDPYEDVSSDIYGGGSASSSQWGDPFDDGTGWDDTVGQHPNTSFDFSWDLPWVAPVIPDWILAQEAADDGMY